MKTITVGRGKDCNIVINDETDEVSRHHFDLQFTFSGKMHVVDKSVNGTYLNGVRLKKNTPTLVHKSDNITLAKKWPLDWSKVKDPYAQTRKLAYILPVLLIVLLLGGIGGYFHYFNSKPQRTTDTLQIHNDSVMVGDSTKRETVESAPNETNKGQLNKTKKKRKRNKTRSVESTSKETPNDQEKVETPKVDDQKVNDQKVDNEAPLIM